jgi:molybdenum cofactor sulfurtransferase
MGNSHSHSQPTATEVHHPRLLKHYKSSPHSLRPSRARGSPPISVCSSSSLNSFSEKDIEREKENQRPSNRLSRTSSHARLSPPSRATPLHPPPPVPAYSSHIILPSPTAGFLSPSPSRGLVSDQDAAYARFLHDYPQYASSWHVDALRRSEYSRLGPDETYVDYMGGAIYPTSLISVHAEFLQSAVLGNTHSESPRFVSSALPQIWLTQAHIRSSKLSAALAATARAAVLSFFNAPPGSTVVFTANASAALKLVGEAFPFTPASAFLLPEDAHNSVHGIREFARSKGAPIVYLPSPPRGGVRVREAFVRLFSFYAAYSPS